ncbi:MAG TPA: UDP-N-acetylglucosamine 2-epimerase (non-hydrolyzing) [Bryobacteraceae bacterium]|nr:UDP-N-acetylglucosamine 2-epimerase (non-hydrolyzing) [Bryobacteraceae bacterium]
MNPLSLTCVVGARPNFIKMAALMHEIRRRPAIKAQLVHTGQHHSPEMSQSFFEELDIPEPDVNLGVPVGTPTQQTAEIMKGIERVFLDRKPDVLVVVGDVTSTLAAALVAVRMGIRIAHVEAGLRSFDRGMPEEINRILTDAISDYLFITEMSGQENLRNEGVPVEKIHFVGNVMIDTLLRFREKAAQSDVLGRLGLEHQGYAVATLHRPSNVDVPERLAALLDMLQSVGAMIPVVFPVHPRTKSKIEAIGRETPGVRFVPPQGYLDFMRLTSSARLVLTDSGGIQEETTILQGPCLTLRENTERPVTVTHGTNQLITGGPGKVLDAVQQTLGAPMPSHRIPELWDGKAAERILDVLERSRSL